MSDKRDTLVVEWAKNVHIPGRNGRARARKKLGYMIVRWSRSLHANEPPAFYSVNGGAEVHASAGVS